MFRIFLSHLHAEADLADAFRQSLHLHSEVEVIQTSRPGPENPKSELEAELREKFEGSVLFILLCTGPDEGKPKRRWGWNIREYEWAANSPTTEIAVFQGTPDCLPKGVPRDPNLVSYFLSDPNSIKQFALTRLSFLNDRQVEARIGDQLVQNITWVLNQWKEKGYDPALEELVGRSRIPWLRACTLTIFCCLICILVTWLAVRNSALPSQEPAPARLETITIEGQSPPFGDSPKRTALAKLLKVAKGQSVSFIGADTENWSIDPLLYARSVMIGETPILIDIHSLREQYKENIGSIFNNQFEGRVDLPFELLINLFLGAESIKADEKSVSLLEEIRDHSDSTEKAAYLPVLRSLSDLKISSGHMELVMLPWTNSDFKEVLAEVRYRVLPAIIDGEHPPFDENSGKDKVELVDSRYVVYSGSSGKTLAATERFWSFVFASDLGRQATTPPFTHSVSGVRASNLDALFRIDGTNDDGFHTFPLPDQAPGTLVCAKYRIGPGGYLELLGQVPFWKRTQKIVAQSEDLYLQFYMNDDNVEDNSGRCILTVRIESNR